MMDQYLRMRLETARELVRPTSLSIGVVAQMAEFSNQSHFADAYRAMFGEPPSAQRRQEPLPKKPRHADAARHSKPGRVR